MITVTLRFFEELNDFLPPKNRRISFQRALKCPATVKDLIESCGVPHTEVDLILVNSVSVDFTHLVSDGDVISVYPVFESIDISGVTRLQQRPLRRLRFVADAHLGPLTRKLRLLGFDVAFDKNATSENLIETMRHEDRVILTTDRHLLMRRIVDRGYCIRGTDTGAQALEVIRRFDLVNMINPLTRCVACNGLLAAVAGQDIESSLEAGTRQYGRDFTQCPACGKIYWKGSHTAGLPAFIAWIKEQVNH